LDKTDFKIDVNLKDLNTDGTLHGLVQLGRKDKNDELCAIAIDKLIDFRKANWEGPAEHPQYGQLAETSAFLKTLQTSPDTEIVLAKRLAEINLALNGFSQTLDLALPAGNEREIFRYMLRSMMEIATPEDIQVEAIAFNFGQFSTVVGDTGLLCLSRLLPNVDIVGGLTEENWSKAQPSFLVWLKSANKDRHRDLVAFLQRRLDALGREKWLEILKQESNELELLLTMVEGTDLSPLGAAYYDALLAHATELIGGGKRPSKFPKRWHVLPLALSKAQTGFFYQRIGDELLSRLPSAAVMLVVLDLLGEAILTRSGLDSRKNQTLRVILDPLLASKEANALSVIETNSSAFRAIVSGADDADIEVLTTRFLDLIKSADDVAKTRYLRLSENLGIGAQLTAALPNPAGTPSEPPDKI
jgi:hypothetical protein